MPNPKPSDPIRENGLAIFCEGESATGKKYRATYNVAADQLPWQPSALLATVTIWINRAIVDAQALLRSEGRSIGTLRIAMEPLPALKAPAHMKLTDPTDVPGDDSVDNSP